MNKTSALTALAIAALAMAAQAVPSGINYQGVLTDSQGQPVTGTRTMSIKLYDAATSGTPLYTEDLGTVSVTDGVFSFEFGTSGTSNAEQSDTVAITDGSASSFQKVLSAASVVAGSVSVTDGTYTWSQSGGSSNDDDFGVAYSTNLRRVTVTYFNGAPAAGRTITATYRTPASGISGALAGDTQPWAEITVDGVAQVPRQKVLTVPFASASSSSTKANTVDGVTRSRSLLVDRFFRQNVNTELAGFAFLPWEYVPSGGATRTLWANDLPGLRSFPLNLPLPSLIKRLSVSVVDLCGETPKSPYNLNNNYGYGNLVVTLYKKAAGLPPQVVAQLDSGRADKPGAVVLTGDLNVAIEGEEVFYVEIVAGYEVNVNSMSKFFDGQLLVNWVKIEIEQQDLN